MDRKHFISRSLQAMAGAAIGGPVVLQAAACSPFRNLGEAAPLVLTQAPLPYPYAALEPHIDAQTMEIHYAKHHAAYVKNANDALTQEGVTALDETGLFAGIGAQSAKLRNNAGGAFNHHLFWNGMAPGKGGAPTGKAGDAISSAFGSFEKFTVQFTEAAMKRFGSGWAWLVEKDGRLLIGSTPNQDNPLMDVSELKGRPLLALDVWEHAYYLKYQNKRNEYVAAWWNLVNWDSVAARLG
jgi:Fe-Mn family superoxide dismutase